MSELLDESRQRKDKAIEEKKRVEMVYLTAFLKVKKWLGKKLWS